jgi:hypothetical protein
LSLTCEFEIGENENVNNSIQKAGHFLHNSLRAEYYRQMSKMPGAKEEDIVKFSNFIETHLANDYLADLNLEQKPVTKVKKKEDK